ncbi:aminopeptidase P family protein [Helicobacter sp. CaF467b]|uniref:M24 family metallopeptidase n=1 Tax=unclassified Helicobacter TaxID=2593540 RepID=UPI001F59A4FD|nr:MULTISPECIES: M24 family metallopeptidase [unclassified Helicobacter]MCI2236551.1 aminopeptidase P family protein [Helicobacter sp. CaF467b]MCI7765433.1 aminopeptidase P family protein [Helicobacter sp.]
MENFIIRDENALYFETHYSCDNAIFLAIGQKGYFITDGRYETEAKEHIKSTQYEIEILISHDLIRTAKNILKKHEKATFIFNPQEFSLYFYEKLTSGLKINFVPKPNFHQEKRICKTKEEIALIEHSQKLNIKAFDKFAAWISKNAKDKNEAFLHFKSQAFLTKKGKYDLSFNPIVGINANAAKPHALPSNDQLLKGDLLLFDAGIKYQRYCSDRTRTGYFGKNGFNFKKEQHFKDSTLQKIYDIVLKAQENAIKHAKAGMLACEIDALARNVIEKAGYGKYFVHSTGHGIGLDIHELPIISARSKTRIEEGMVFSIEPGIYIPNKYGVRIEDLVVIESNGARILGE